MIFEVIASLLLIIFVWDYLSKKRKNDILMKTGIFGPKSIPILGNVLMYRGQGPEGIMKLIVKNRGLYGSLYRVWIFRQLAIFSCDPSDVEIILSSHKHITKNNLYELLHVWLGNGLLMSTGNKWHTRRKIITPTFHFKILDQFVQIFDQQTTIMVRKLQQLADGETAINIFPIICLTALDIIAETAMGTKINAQEQPHCSYTKAVTDVTNITSKRFINVWQRKDWIFRLTAPKIAKQLEESIKIMHEFTKNIIIDRRNKLEKLISSGLDKRQDIANILTKDNVEKKSKMALLDVLLLSRIDGQPLSNEDIQEEVDTFMFEGHDTTTSGISFCLCAIARHPDVQKKLVNEIRTLLGDDKNKPITQNDLSKLKYMECVIKESLRLYPPVPMIGRYFKEDVKIRGKTIPGGSNYTVGIYVMLRDPKYFPKPNDFIPERFLKASPVDVNPYSYIPFSAGPRNCIGQRFAMLEMKTAITKVLHHFELLPFGPEPKPMMNLVLRSANGNHLGLKPRS